MNYFWKNGNVITLDGNISRDDVKRADLTDCYNFETDQREHQQTGMFRGTGADWKHIPFKELPPEFRMHLLLLGVS